MPVRGVLVEGFVTTRQASEMLGVSHSRVRQLIASGRLPSTLVGPRMRLVAVDDLDKVRDRGPAGWPKGKPRSAVDGDE